MSKVKILYVDDVFDFGGGEKHIFSLLERIDKNKYDVSIACRKDSFFSKELKNLGFKVEHIRFQNKFDFVGAFRFFKLLVKNRYDIVNLQDNRSHWLGALASYFAKVPVVLATVHMVNVLRRESISVFLKIVLKIADFIWASMVNSIITISHYNKRALISEGINSNKIEVIYNGIDQVCSIAKTPNNIRQELNIDPNILIVGSVARLSKQKGLSYLIDAVAKLKSDTQKMIFLVIGDGPDKDEFVKYAKLKGVDDMICFLGFKDNARSYLKAFDLFILPSIYEGLPIAIIEAMMESKPIIATSAGAVNEMLVNGETGLIIPSKNPDAIVKSVKELIADPHRRHVMGEKARQTAKEKFNIGIMAKKTFGLYEELLKEC